MIERGRGDENETREQRADENVSTDVFEGSLRVTRRDENVLRVALASDPSSSSLVADVSRTRFVISQLPNHAFPNLPLLGSSPNSPCTFAHLSFPGSSRKHASMAETAFEMLASSPFSCQ